MFNRSTMTAALQHQMLLLWQHFAPLIELFDTRCHSSATHMPVQGSTQQMEMGMKIIMLNKCFFVFVFSRRIFPLHIPVNVAVSIVSLTAKKAWNACLCWNQNHKVLSPLRLINYATWDK